MCGQWNEITRRRRAERADGITGRGREETGVASFVATRVDQSPFPVLVERHQATGTQIG